MTISFGAIWRDALRLLRADPAMVAVAMVVSTLPGVIADLTLSEMSAFRAVSTMSLVTLLVQIIAVDRSLRASNAVSGRELGRASFYPRAFGQSILYGLAVIIGLICFILPGIFIALRWSVSLPVLIARNGGVAESLNDSWQMTKGQGFRLFGIFCAALSPIFLVLLVEAFVIEASGLGWLIVSESVFSAVLIMCWYLQTAAFLALRMPDEIGS